MRAIVVESADQLLWQEVPDILPGHDEVLIKVSAAGVNRADVLQARGAYPPPPGASTTLGLEVSGVITAIGSGVTTWNVGQEVCALLAGGGYAEYVSAPTGQVMPIPRGVTTAEAAALPEAACTVWSTVIMAAQLKPHDTILIHGGASGIGTHAVLLAKELGSRVAVTAGSPRKLDFCRELGADIVISHRDEDFVARIREATDGAGADVILDIMGAAYLHRNLDALAYDGRLAIISMQGGTTAELNIATLMGKRLQISGTQLRGRPYDGAHGKSVITAAVVDSVWPMIAAGGVRPVIGAWFPITDAAQAHQALVNGDIIGKALLSIP